MQTEIHIKIAPSDSISETEIERLLRMAEESGQTPAEFVAAVLRGAAAKATPTAARPD